MGTRAAGLAIGLLTASYGVGQVLESLITVALAGGPSGFGFALFVAASPVALGGLLMPVVGLLWARGQAPCEENHAHGGLDSLYLIECAQKRAKDRNRKQEGEPSWY